MFRITEDPSSGSLVQYLAKITRMVLSCPLDSVDMDVVHVNDRTTFSPEYTRVLWYKIVNVFFLNYVKVENFSDQY